ncbi:DUF2147 domain-containing protein [Acinetobacter sp. ANC 4779]|uniref:DUF2147 domain-containing protein n=1 Tax=Acinetobacter sp. ANC 4779 TaxID=2529848 RepID=UPI00103FAE1E|nr:DUF2147 domain-containing protein [Acinetobacter sp. ANC 4779]TCB51456.1 DUF2147 domain-containing protein [Acinetobacter sp. ANC 4779]
MKTIFGIIALSLFYSSAMAQNIEGIWRYMDDKTGEAKGLVKIEQQVDGTYAGKVLKATPRQGYTPKEFCTNCPAPYTNQPIIGMQVISKLKSVDQVNYTDGKIIDPVSGKIYKLKGKLNATGKKLFLRGYMGVSAVGRSQTWLRVE